MSGDHAQYETLRFMILVVTPVGVVTSTYPEYVRPEITSSPTTSEETTKHHIRHHHGESRGDNEPSTVSATPDHSDSYDGFSTTIPTDTSSDHSIQTKNMYFTQNEGNIPRLFSVKQL